MTEAKYSIPSAVIVLLERQLDGKTYVLCQRRQNTGFADGLYDFSYSGKVEYGESATSAAIREAKEELGVGIKPEELEFAALVHKRDSSAGVIFYNLYFICKNFSGEATVCERDKCSQIEWFPEDGLPEDLIDDRRKAFEAIARGQSYLEYGW